MHYAYSGKWSGLLPVLHHIVTKKDEDCHIDLQTSLFVQEGSSPVLSSEEEAYRVLHQTFSQELLYKCYLAFLSEKERIEEGIAQYLLLAKKMGAGILNYWQHPVVNLIEYQVKKVSREKHLLLGVLRFQPLEESEILYAPFEPTYRVIYLLGSAFKKRLNHLPFILHDKKRNIACLHWQSELLFQEHFFEQHLSKKNDVDEDPYEELWRAFFKAVTIESRKNLKCEQQHLPKKYWKYLTEKNLILDARKTG